MEWERRKMEPRLVGKDLTSWTPVLVQPMLAEVGMMRTEDEKGSKGRMESSMEMEMELGKMNPSCRGWAGGAGGVPADLPT